MKKPGSWFAPIKMWKKKPKEKKKKRISNFTQKFTLGQFSVPAGANQHPGFFIRGTLTPNGLFEAFKISMGYSKSLDKLKYGALFHLKCENLELFLTIKISYFLFFRYVKISESTII